MITENPKKSYNYMASPNYLQYENTYQKYKNMCHSKDVTNFRDNNPSNQQDKRAYHHRNHNNDEYVIDDHFTELEMKAENTMQSSDDEGGFRQNAMYTKNQFNHHNSINSCNGINGNIGYNTKEIEPLLRGVNNHESVQMLKVFHKIHLLLEFENSINYFDFAFCRHQMIIMITNKNMSHHIMQIQQRLCKICTNHIHKNILNQLIIKMELTIITINIIINVIFIHHIAKYRQFHQCVCTQNHFRSFQQI